MNPWEIAEDRSPTKVVMSPVHNPTQLPYLEVGASRAEAELTVIWMHGLGADGYDFQDVTQALSRVAAPQRWRFVLPHAKELPITISTGLQMPAWYDIISLSQPREVDWSTVAQSQAMIEELISAEPASRLVLAGFSQGAAMALHVGLQHQTHLAGILVLSGYLLENAEHPVAPCNSSVPIRILHGQEDDVVPPSAAAAAATALQGVGYNLEITTYEGLGHSVNEQEIQAVLAWLQERANA